MTKALFYKEWIKTRLSVLLILALFAGFIIYTFIDTAQMFRVSAPEAVWNNIILKDIVMVSYMKWLPLIAGIAIALTQYVPEMTDKRLKLTLHLPLSENKIISWMSGYGVMVLFLLFVISYVILLSGLSYYFPREMIIANFLISLPWFLGGFATYMLTVWIIYEPVWKYRVANTLIAVLALMLFFLKGKAGAYLPFYSYLIILCIISCFFPFYSVSRFKAGAQ